MRTTRYHHKTDQELRRLVAEATGWRVLRQEAGEAPGIRYGPFYHLKGPDDPELPPATVVFEGRSTEDDVWLSRPYPDFPTDLNAIYKVFKDSGCQWNLWNDYKEFHCLIDIFKGDNQFPFGAVKVEEDTPARAMCVAWLLWNDQEENQ